MHDLENTLMQKYKSTRFLEFPGVKIEKKHRKKIFLAKKNRSDSKRSVYAAL
jgi:hypothetical protein